MATYIRGAAVDNATSYELYKKDGGDYVKLAENTSLDFNLDDLGLEPGDYLLSVKAKAAGYEDSDISNDILYKVASA